MPAMPPQVVGQHDHPEEDHACYAAGQERSHNAKEKMTLI
jgi:hypothetical protein